MTDALIIKIVRDPSRVLSDKAADISKERSVVNVKNFDAVLYGERKENGFPRSFCGKFKLKQIQCHASWNRLRNKLRLERSMQKRPEICLKHVCLLQFTDE